MAENTIIAEEQIRTTSAVDEVLPPGQLFMYGLQHVLAMYAGAVAVSLVVGGALKLSQEQLIFLISADLFTCGIATLIQTLGLGRIPPGIKIPLIQGCTFAARRRKKGLVDRLARGPADPPTPCKKRRAALRRGVSEMKSKNAW